MAKYFNILFLLFFISILFASCRTIRETQTEYVTIHDTDTIRQVRTQRDSVFIFEKQREYLRGDTVYLDRWHYEYRDKATADTLRLVKTVTITSKLYYTKEKEVNRLKWWQKALMWCGAASLGFIIVLLITKYKAWRLFK